LSVSIYPKGSPLPSLEFWDDGWDLMGDIGEVQEAAPASPPARRGLPYTGIPDDFEGGCPVGPSMEDIKK